MVVGLTSFPHSTECGLIEVDDAKVQMIITDTFRIRQSAASLKSLRLRQYRTRTGSFRIRQSAASLKCGCTTWLHVHPEPFRIRQSAASLKWFVLAWLAVLLHLSAFDRVRPH